MCVSISIESEILYHSPRDPSPKRSSARIIVDSRDSTVGITIIWLG